MYKPENPAPTITASRAVVGSVAVIVPPIHGAAAAQPQQRVPRVSPGRTLHGRAPPDVRRSADESSPYVGSAPVADAGTSVGGASTSGEA